MARRAPIQVVVLPFRRRRRTVEYAVLRRSDDGAWQGIAGGADERETPAAAARREANEEAAVPVSAALYELASTSFVPIEVIREKERRHWPRGLLVIPNYAFAVDCTGCELRLSGEHTTVRWARFEVASRLLRYEGNRIALWELNERLRRDSLPAPVQERAPIGRKRVGRSVVQRFGGS